jgi:hypothetical protein
MKTKLMIMAALMLATSLVAQTPPTFIKGTIEIKYNTRTNLDGDKPAEGAYDRYNFNLNVSNSALFRGNIDVYPLLSGITGVYQRGTVGYNLDCDIVNPNNPAQTKNVGKLVGNVPVDENNVYRFQEGNLKISIFPMGASQGFEGKYGGFAYGKPPVKKGWFDKAKEAVTLTNSKGTIVLTKYDKMQFENHELVGGPVQAYSPVRVNGEMLYDYNRSAWFIKNIAAVYTLNNQVVNDTIAGNIRWVNTGKGEGEYQFDVRVNEPPATEASAFAGPTDESAFFTNDVKIPSLVGSMKYRDSVVKDVVVSSVVTVDLTGNQLTKQQAMYLMKLLFITSVVPLNSE